MQIKENPGAERNPAGFRLRSSQRPAISTLSLRGLLIAATFFATGATADISPPRIAIIIDDLGYQQSAGERAIRLPGPVAYAILPATPRATYLAEAAHAGGKEVLLHLPLQAMRDHAASEPGELMLDMSQDEFVTTLVGNIESVPHAIGVNNHRGSLLTRHPGHMKWLMEEIRRQGDLFFVDSYTTASSVALHIAREQGVPAVKRDVFLDPDMRAGTLQREFARLKALARRQGFAVGIGHPHATTLDYLESALPELEREGFELVSISELVVSQQEARHGAVAAE